MNIELYGWLVLLFPLFGAVAIGFGWRFMPGRLPGYLGTAAIAASFVSSVLTLLALNSRGEE